MRGDLSVIAGVPQAIAVLDLALAGVSAELGDTPFDWLGSAKATPKEAVAAPVPVEAPVLKGVEVDTTPKPVFAPLLPDSPLSAQAKPVRKALPAVAEIPARVWREAEGADVVMVVQGEMPDERCQQLARAMLAAVGLKDKVLGFVGYEGKVAADVLRAEVVSAGGAEVLVMGQGPLGVLLGRNLGVEGWHAAGGADTLGLETAVGVTYPLELLLKQPLFKRLAWQHMLAWGDHSFKNKGD
jgi:hypothetical protein